MSGDPQPVLLGTVRYQGEVLAVYRTIYVINGRPAIFLRDPLGAPYCKVSTNCVQHDLRPGELILHHDVRPTLAQALLASGLVADTGRKVDYGHVTGQPVWRLAAAPAVSL